MKLDLNNYFNNYEYENKFLNDFIDNLDKISNITFMILTCLIRDEFKRRFNKEKSDIWCRFFCFLIKKVLDIKVLFFYNKNGRNYYEWR